MRDQNNFVLLFFCDDKVFEMKNLVMKRKEIVDEEKGVMKKKQYKKFVMKGIKVVMKKKQIMTKNLL